MTAQGLGFDIQEAVSAAEMALRYNSSQVFAGILQSNNPDDLFAAMVEDQLGEEEEKEPEENKDSKPQSQIAKNINTCHEAAEYVDAMYEQWAQEETNPVIKFCKEVGLRAIRRDDTYGLELNSGFKGTVQTIEGFPEHLDLACTQVQHLQNGLSLEPGCWGKIEDYGLGILGTVSSLQVSIAIEGKPGKLKKSTWSRPRNKGSSKARAFPAQSTRPQKASAEAWLQKTMPSQGIGSANSSANSATISRPSLQGLDLASSAGVNVKGIKQPWTIRPGQEWKQQVFGTGQKTGTSGHATKSYRTAIEQVKNNPQKIALLNRGLKRATGEPIRQRPDVTVVEMVDNNVKIHQFEVPSKTDDVVKLMERMEVSRQKLSTGKRGNIKVELINKGKLND